MEEGKNAIKILKSTPKGERPLGRPRRRWEDYIRMEPKQISNNSRNGVYLAQDRDYRRALLYAALNLQVA